MNDPHTKLLSAALSVHQRAIPLHLPHGSKRLIGKLSKGFDFLGYRVVAGRRLRSSAESKRRFDEKFRRPYVFAD